MSRKVTITTYTNNPAATFWSRLGSLGTYVAPLVGFAVLFAGLPIADKHQFGVIFWIFWVALSIFAAIAFFVLVFGLCGMMEMKALNKASEEAGTPAMPGNDLHAPGEWKPESRPKFDPMAPPSGDTIDFSEIREEIEKALEK